MKRKPNSHIQVGRDAKSGRFTPVRQSRKRAKRILEIIRVSRGKNGRYR